MAENGSFPEEQLPPQEAVKPPEVEKSFVNKALTGTAKFLFPIYTIRSDKNNFSSMRDFYNDPRQREHLLFGSNFKDGDQVVKVEKRVLPLYVFVDIARPVAAGIIAQTDIELKPLAILALLSPNIIMALSKIRPLRDYYTSKSEKAKK